MLDAVAPEHFVLVQLADGRFHSGAALAEQLQVSRTAVWKYIRSLSARGLEIFSVPGKGYRLASPLDLLDTAKMHMAMEPESFALLTNLEIHLSLDSTNSYLKNLAQQGAASGHVCMAEHQSQGRGRRGKAWVSPVGCNLYFSVLWRYQNAPANLGGLSLVLAVGVARALQKIGLNDVGVKWPNDIWWREQKLAGILLEMTGEAGGACHVVAGIGVNVAMPVEAASGIDQSWADVAGALGKPVSRNHLAGLILHEILPLLRDFPQAGLQLLRNEWRRYDALAGRAVKIIYTPERELVGVAAGIDDDGALLLHSNGEIQRIYSGEVSLRPV
ncbi:MAG: bifunctional biotin--[acetyl-CoA-carboxylase] ligase/biotin operon repressor BirA [Pseudomonadota bacterium]